MTWGIVLLVLGVSLAAISDWIGEWAGPPRFWFKCVIISLIAVGVLKVVFAQ